MELSGRRLGLKEPRQTNTTKTRVNRREFLAASSFAVLGTFLSAFFYEVGNGDNSFESSDKIKSFTLFTQNCQGAPNRKNDVRIESFEKIGNNISSMTDLPDVVLLQEVVFENDVEILKRSLEDTYSFHYNKKNILSLISGGLLVLIKKEFASLFENIDFAFHKFSEQGNIFKGQSSDIIIGKGFTDISLNIRNKCLSLINTHLLSIYSGDIDSDLNLKAQLEEISYYIKAKIQDDVGVVLAGDLNIPIYSCLYSQITDFLKDLSENTGPTWNDEKLDYVFGNQGGPSVNAITAIDQGSLSSGEPATDHKGIFCELEI